MFTNLVKNANNNTLITQFIKMSKFVTKFQCFLEIFCINKQIIIHAIKIDLNLTISIDLYTIPELIMKPILINI